MTAPLPDIDAELLIDSRNELDDPEAEADGGQVKRLSKSSKSSRLRYWEERCEVVMVNGGATRSGRIGWRDCRVR